MKHILLDILISIKCGFGLIIILFIWGFLIHQVIYDMHEYRIRNPKRNIKKEIERMNKKYGKKFKNRKSSKISWENSCD